MLLYNVLQPVSGAYTQPDSKHLEKFKKKVYKNLTCLLVFISCIV